MLGNKYVAGIVGILLIIVIVYNAQFFLSKNKTSSTAANVQQAINRSGSSSQPEKVRPAKSVQPSGKEDKGIWKRDPFSLQAQTGSKAAEMTDEIRLMGILKRDGKSHALINGRVYGVHDRIGTAVLKEIRQHSIVVLTEGKQQEIVFDDYKVIKEKKK